jgi:crotonobetainyl-CoA:carnitine CoA-transferase CaiB-like acyl-CoA transferase
MTDQPLRGVKVLELARILAGPWAGQLLADLGADVIKIESPVVGDDTRTWGPPFVTPRESSQAEAAYFHCCNRGKRSVAVELNSMDGQDVVRGLADHADVLIENFKVNGLKKYGLDFNSLHARNPKLVYCSITGFGQTGPYAGRAGYDFLIQAMGGMMDITGAPEGEPQKVGVAYVDILTGVYAVVAILSALHRRERTGIGGHVDMALLDCEVAGLANQALNYLATGVSPMRLGNAHPNIVPYQLFQVRDGRVVIAAGNDAQFARLCHVLGVSDLARDPRFSTNPSRVIHREELVAALATQLIGFDLETLLIRLECVGVPAGPINSIAEVFSDPQVRARELAIVRQRSNGDRNEIIPGVRSPIVLDGEAMFSATASPILGIDTAPVLKALSEGGWPMRGAAEEPVK